MNLRRLLISILLLPIMPVFANQQKDPELLEIPGTEGAEEGDPNIAVQHFIDQLNYQAPTKNIPLQGVAGMSANELTTQNLLAKFLGTPATYTPATYKSTATEGEAYKVGLGEIKKTLGGEFYDPRTSDFWKGYREVSAIEQERGVSDIRRRGQLGGGLYGEPNQRTEADYLKGMGATRTMMLGGLYEKERDRKSNAVMQALGYAGHEEQSKQFGATFGEQSRQFGAGFGERGKISRLTAGHTIGATPRNIQNQELKAIFNQAMGQEDTDFMSSMITTATQTGAAQELMPQWNIDQGGGTSPLGGILGIIGALAQIGK